MKIEDNILIKEIQQGNHAVFETLFQDYFPLLSRYAESFIYCRQSAEDIVQNLFVYLWENANHLSIQSSLKAYLYHATRNRCLNFLRDLHIHDKHNLLYLEADIKGEGEKNLEDPEIIRKIQEAIEQLPPQIAVIFKLKYFQEKKHSEIASYLNISENTVKTQVSRGKEKLRKQLLNLTNLYFMLF